MSTTTNGVPVPGTPTSPPQVMPQSSRWDLQSLMHDMEAEMERLFGRRSTLRGWGQGLRLGGDWTPSVDVFEKNGKLVIQVELPGVAREDVEVTMEDNDLVLKGTRTNERDVTQDAYFRMERFSGAFLRRIPLPTGIQATDLSAEFKDGVLTITANKPLVEVTNSTRIEIA